MPENSPTAADLKREVSPLPSPHRGGKQLKVSGTQKPLLIYLRSPDLLHDLDHLAEVHVHFPQPVFLIELERNLRKLAQKFFIVFEDDKDGMRTFFPDYPAPATQTPRTRARSFTFQKRHGQP